MVKKLLLEIIYNVICRDKYELMWFQLPEASVVQMDGKNTMTAVTGLIQVTHMPGARQSISVKREEPV